MSKIKQSKLGGGMFGDYSASRSSRALKRVNWSESSL